MNRWSVGLLLASFAAAPMAAQAVAAVASFQSHAAKGSPVKQITVAFDNTILIDAIRTITRQSGQKVVFAPSMLPLKRVTYRGTNVSVESALAAVLGGTGLRLVTDPSGALLVLKDGGTTKGSAQGTVTGKVTDAATKQPVVGASVQIEGVNRATQTNEYGTFKLSDVPTGSHTLVIRRIGYAKTTCVITVNDNATAALDVSLDVSANALEQVVVTGTVAATELKAVPSAITVVTAKQIEERGITKIDQLFRGDIPGLFALNMGSGATLDEVTMFSRGATALSGTNIGTGSFTPLTNPIKTYIDGVEIAEPRYLSQIDPRSIERIEILTGPQASTIYGSNAINGVMQIFTKRGASAKPQLTLNLLSGWVENNFSTARAPEHDYGANLAGIEGRLAYSAGGSWYYMGPWSPSKQLARLGGFGGVRLELPTRAGCVTTDLSLRRTLTKTIVRGSGQQTYTEYRASGWWQNLEGSLGRVRPTMLSVTAQTFGLSLSYAPTTWWSQELGLGNDVSDSEQRATERAYTSPGDTTLIWLQPHIDRRSLRYTATVRVPVTSLAQLTVTAGIDSWQSIASAVAASPQVLTGTLSNTLASRRPGHNTGGFLQPQLGIMDRLFLTYGVRMEKNPTIGENARVIPGRYGAAYTHDIGPVTAKMRASYGRSIRPPLATLKDTTLEFESTVIGLYGVHNAQLANPELTAEYQQGGEGGLELYLGNRASLVMTRYNQIVDRLITSVFTDSIRTLVPCPGSNFSCRASSSFRDADGFAYKYLSRNINVGSIRNQGWELQGNINMGPLATRGTYSWTKSRVIGVAPKYRAFFANNPQYQLGASFQGLPEHTWALGMTYTRASSSIGINLTGLGRVPTYENKFYLENLGPLRLPQGKLNVSSLAKYVHFNSPYALADLTASHRFNSAVEALLQVQNLEDRYIHDYYATYASLGRQAKFGFRLRAR